MTLISSDTGASSATGGLAAGWGSNEGGANQQFTNGCRTNNGTNDTSSHTDDVLIDVPSGDSSSDWIGAVNAWENDRVRIDVQDASGVDRYTLVLLIGDAIIF